MSEEKPKRPEGVGPVGVSLYSDDELIAEYDAIVSVTDCTTERGLHVATVIPVGESRVVEMRLTTKQAYSLAMALLRVRAAVTRALKRAAN